MLYRQPILYDQRKALVGYGSKQWNFMRWILISVVVT